MSGNESVKRDQVLPRKYIALLALIAGGILVIGSLLRPEKKPAVITVSEVDKLQLQRVMQKKTLQEMASYFASVARDAARHLVWIGDARAAGVAWSREGLVVTARRNGIPTRPGSALPPGSANPPVVPVSSSADFGAATFRIGGTAEISAVPRLPRPPESGSWVVQVSLREDGRHWFSPGIYNGVAAAACGRSQYNEVMTSIPLKDSMLGGGLFDMDGNLVALILACGDRTTAVTPDSVDEMVLRAGRLEARLLAQYGMRVEPLDPDLRPVVGSEEGLWVAEVTEGGRADAAGLKPGDVITHLDGAPVRQTDDLQQLVLPRAYEKLELRLIRRRRTIRLDFSVSKVGADKGVFMPPGIHLQLPAQGYAVEAVDPGSKAERAGVQSGDRLLEIGGRRPSGIEAVRRLFTSGGQAPTFVVVQRGSRKLGLALK